MKVVLIGAGSFVFSVSVLNDLIIDHRVSDGELVLVDVDPEILHTMQGVGRRMADEAGTGLPVSATMDRTHALPDADFVLLSAETEGRKRWLADYEVLKGFGLHDQGRECGGVEGLMHALRSITLAMGVARDIREHCPKATMLVMTNPMPRVVTAVHRYAGCPVIGFCNGAHGGYGGYEWLAGLVRRRPEDVEVITAGLNHFAWLLEIKDKRTGRDLKALVEEEIETRKTREFEILREWLHEFGAVGVVGAGHMGEYLPYDPTNTYHTRPPFHGDPDERLRALGALRDVAAGRRHWRDALATRSWERPIDVAVALQNRWEADFDIVNLPNAGYLPQLPHGRIVEVPACARGGRLSGRRVPPLPEKLAALCNTVSDVIELSAQAAVTGDRYVIRRIIDIDPAVTDKASARDAVDELLRTNADLLPQFFLDRRKTGHEYGW